MDLSRKRIEELAEIVKRNPAYFLADRLFMFTKTYEVLGELEENITSGEGWIRSARNLLEILDISPSMSGQENIPLEGSTIYVSNHPWGIVEGLFLISLLGKEVEKRGRKLKVMGTYQINAIKDAEDAVLFVNREEDRTTENSYQNIRALRRTIQHLKSGQDLSFFPASSTSYKINRKTQDPPWNSLVGKLSKYSPIIPMWFSGSENGFAYNAAAALNPKWRYLLFFRELWNKKGTDINLRIGEKIDESRLNGMNPLEKTEYIRTKCEELR